MKFLSFVNSKKNKHIDLPITTAQRGIELKRKFFLKNVYTQFYKEIYSELSVENKKGKVVELGSGGGFIKKIIPNTVTSDIMKLPNVDLQISALKMPFNKSSINAFVMFDVFHHINKIDKFLTEADKTLKINGQIIMVEPANTLFGSFIYKYFHHEPYNPKGKWEFKENGPLSGANLALAWIVFVRDRKKFEKKYPNLKITKISSHTPLKFLLSGGFSFRQMLPNSFYGIVSFTEGMLSPFNKWLGMFYTISITKIK